MSRTYRTPPTRDFIDPRHTKKEREEYRERFQTYLEENVGMLRVEARMRAHRSAGRVFPTKLYFSRRVPEGDERACAYSRPRAHRKKANRRARKHADQRLRKMVNERATAEDFEAMTPLPVPKQYYTWYW